MNLNHQIVKMNVSTPAKVYSLAGYIWNRKSNQLEAYGQYVGFLESVVSGDPEQAEKHKEELKDIFLFDASLNSVALARQRGIAAKMFSVSRETKPILKVKGREFNWILKDAGISSHPVPARFRNVVEEVNRAGILFDGFYIGEPEVQQLPAPRTQRKRDPVLVARLGRWLIELGRWG